MLTIRATVRPSPIHGLGCFTAEPIRKGQLVWKRDEPFDIAIPYEALASFPEPTRAFLAMYGYATVSQGRRAVVLCADHAKHMNHSEEPNLIEGDPDDADYAARDIAAGEELTCNYYHFDLDVALKLGASPR